MSEALLTSGQPAANEIVLDELVGLDGETPIAQWKLTPAAIGALATYQEFSPEVDIVLKGHEWEHHERGQAFVGFRSGAIRARSFAEHRKLGPYAQKLGFSYKSSPATGVTRQATLPTADYLNGILNSMPHMEGRFRFYTPEDENGVASIEEYLQRLAEGRAPLAAPRRGHSYMFTHDVLDHAVGYTLISPSLVEVIRERASVLQNSEISRNTFGYMHEDDPTKMLVDAVDEISAVLGRPLRFYWERVAAKDISELVNLCAVLKQVGEKTSRPRRLLSITALRGISTAVILQRSRQSEYR